jgi:hypothetical protein
MYKRLDRAHRAMSLVLAVLTFVSLGMLLAWNVNPKFFPLSAHGFLAAIPLAMIAIAYLLFRALAGPQQRKVCEFAKWFCDAILEAGSRWRKFTSRNRVDAKSQTLNKAVEQADSLLLA